YSRPALVHCHGRNECKPGDEQGICHDGSVAAFIIVGTDTLIRDAGTSKCRHKQKCVSDKNEGHNRAHRRRCVVGNTTKKKHIDQGYGVSHSLINQHGRTHAPQAFVEYATFWRNCHHNSKNKNTNKKASRMLANIGRILKSIQAIEILTCFTQHYGRWRIYHTATT